MMKSKNNSYKHKLRKKLSRRKGADTPATGEAVPRITNETVAAHRDEILGSARKYKYPLQHSKHRIVVVSATLFIVALVVFFTYCTLAIYRYQNTSTFLYKVSRVIPFPVARAAGRFVAYENYLFEVRRYQYYYENQLKVDFSNPKDREQLDQNKRRALDKVINDTYIKILAEQNNITVSDHEVEDQIRIASSQNRLGGSDEAFETVLKDHWGWSIDDFKRSLHQQLLAEKVVATLDKETTQRAQEALEKLRAGADFGEIAKQYSDDEGSKGNGGEYGFAIDRTSRIPVQATDILFKLTPGEVSDIVNTGTSLEILKNIETNNDKIRAAHIVFHFKTVDTYINTLKDNQNYTVYLRIAESPSAEGQPGGASAGTP